MSHDAQRAGQKEDEDFDQWDEQVDVVSGLSQTLVDLGQRSDPSQPGIIPDKVANPLE